jgi:peptidoglycan/LPS O-acetylase OafA/YrhL
MTDKQPLLPFRPDIDGLRAIAVLLVVFCHYGIPGFSGGFVGVDMFFVISGFLITRLLVFEYETTGGLSLARFYANRLRRLLPALGIMLVACAIAAELLLPDSRNIELGRTGAWATFWASNFHFAFSDTDYFAEDAATNAFLHTWSLGVEEQFYLLWPLLILLCGKRPGSKAALLALVGVVSLVACMGLTTTQPMLAYYMMPARAWQFAAGGAIWLLGRGRQSPHSSLVGWSGVAALFAGLFLIGPSIGYPGAWALLPTLGTCALLWAGQGVEHPRGAPAWWLSLPAMQITGRLSYSLYLWHWPVLIIGGSLLPIKGQPSGIALALPLSLGLAFATHRLVENPVRYGPLSRARPWVQIGLALCLTILLGSRFLQWSVSAEASLDKEGIYAKAAADVPSIYRDKCDDWYRSDELRPCIYGNSSAGKTAVLLGDSIGAQWFPAVEAILDPQTWQIVVLTKSSCPMVDEPIFYARIGREYTECTSWRNKAIAWINGRHVDRVFIGGTASSEFTDQQWIEGTRRILEEVGRNAGHVYLIEANPVLGFHGPSCLAEHGSGFAPGEGCRSSAGNPRYEHVAEMLKTVATSTPKVSWLETSSWVCPGGHCEAFRDGMIVFRDNQHLTATFAATAAAHLNRQIQSAEALQE